LTYESFYQVLFQHLMQLQVTGPTEIIGLRWTVNSHGSLLNTMHAIRLCIKVCKVLFRIVCSCMSFITESEIIMIVSF